MDFDDWLQHPLGIYAATVFVAAVVMLETGADLRLPWWIIGLTAGTAVAFDGRRLAAVIRGDWAAVLFALGLATLAWAALCGAAWIGEEGQEGLWRPERWWLEAAIMALWATSRAHGELDA